MKTTRTLIVVERIMVVLYTWQTVISQLTNAYSLGMMWKMV